MKTKELRGEDRCELETLEWAPLRKPGRVWVTGWKDGTPRREGPATFTALRSAGLWVRSLQKKVFKVFLGQSPLLQVELPSGTREGGSLVGVLSGKEQKFLELPAHLVLRPR